MQASLSITLLCVSWMARGEAKWVEGRIDTKENWSFLSRFCFLSLEGQFEYLIEFDRDMGSPNLLLYYDDDNQWPAVYHSEKSCKEREAVLNKNGQNQVITLSHWYPDTEYSGCIVTRENKELPASKSSTTTTRKPSRTTRKPSTKKPKNSTKTDAPLDPTFYDQFLKDQKNKTVIPKTNSTITTIVDGNSTTWYEIVPTDVLDFTTGIPEEEWEHIGSEENGTRLEKLKDVEILFDNNNGSRKIKRHTALYERFRRRRLNADSLSDGRSERTEKLIVSCHNTRRFRSARERWWFIAISNCDSTKGLDIKYKFLMTNGPDGDFWHQHFSADEFYVLPVLIAFTFAYIIMIIAVVICSVELKSRHLLHSTYKLFVCSVTAQHCGVLMQTLAYVRYAVDGVGNSNTVVVGQFLCGLSETSFLLLLLLLGKGYTVTRGRLKVGFTVKLTVFMCCYLVTYVVLFIYQAKAFDPGEVLYLYESPAGYGLIILRVTAWCMFAYATYFTCRKYPEKNMFYCPFFICGTLWFYAGPLFILISNSYIDKWVRESVVAAVLLFITLSGHFMFMLLTLPVFANKNFPYHVRTTQIGVMEVTGSAAIDSFGPNAYFPGNGAPQTVIIPLTRRTEELIGHMYSQYMSPGPPFPLANGTPNLNGKTALKLTQQSSSDTNTSEDINPYVPKDIFTVEKQIASDKAADSSAGVTRNDSVLPLPQTGSPLSQNGTALPARLENSDCESLPTESLPMESNVDNSRMELPNVLKSRRNILEPIRRDVPVWSLAKGPSVVATMKKPEPPERNGSLTTLTNGALPPLNGVGKQVPPVKNGFQLSSSGEISTIHEGHVQSYKNNVSKATIDLFSAKKV